MVAQTLGRHLLTTTTQTDLPRRVECRRTPIGCCRRLPPSRSPSRENESARVSESCSTPAGPRFMKYFTVNDASRAGGNFLSRLFEPAGALVDHSTGRPRGPTFRRQLGASCALVAASRRFKGVPEILRRQMSGLCRSAGSPLRSNRHKLPRPREKLDNKVRRSGNVPHADAADATWTTSSRSDGERSSSVHMTLGRSHAY